MFIEFYYLNVGLYVKPTAKPIVKAKERTATVKLSEIKSGNNFFVHIVGDEAVDVIDKSMKIFTATHGKSGAPCDVKVGKTVAALFNDGLWYRAKILEKKVGKVKVLFIDYGNTSTVSIATHLRPLDVQLDTDRIPATAKECVLVLTKTRSLEDDEGIEAARFLQQSSWGTEMRVRIFCENEGKLEIALYKPNSANSINEEMIADGLARVMKKKEYFGLLNKVVNADGLMDFAGDLNAAEETARKSRIGMWRYGDVGDDDEEEY